ncbi:MAG: hypothetical protein V1494_05740 [Candidatus Diapherotrites archaeon]
MKAWFLALCAAMLLLAVSVNAAEFTGGCSFSGVQCDLMVKELMLCNNSASDKTFFVSSSGDKASWLNVVPESVSLVAGECKPVNVAYIAPCYQAPGNYSAEVTAKAGTDTAAQACILEVKQGNEAMVSVSPGAQSATQCENKAYAIDVSNNSTVPNQNEQIIYLNVSGIPAEWFRLAKESIVVGKGATESVDLNVMPPCTAALGKYDFKVTASLFNKDFKSDATASYEITQGQAVELSAPEKLGKCMEETEAKKITVKNTGKLADEFTLSVDGPEWVKLAENTVSLAAGASSDLDLILEKSERQGSFKVEITAESKKFGVKESAEFSVVSENCFELSLEKVSGDESVCAEETPEMEFTAKNKGSRDFNGEISFRGFNSLPQTVKVYLRPEESQSIKLQLDVSGIIDANSGGKKAKPVKKDLIASVSSEFFYLDEKFPITVNDCYNLSAEKTKAALCAKTGSEISLTVNNLGSKDRALEVNVFPGWISAEKELTVKANSSAKLLLKAIVPENAPEKEAVVSLKDRFVSMEEKIPIEYLDERECFGLEASASDKEVDAVVGEGTKFTLSVSNRGMVAQTISLSADKEWVYIFPKTIELARNETQEVFFLISPPFDAREQNQKVVFSIDSNYGFTAETEITVGIFGARQGIEPVKLSIEAGEGGKADANAIETAFTLSNNGAKALLVYSIEALDFNAEIKTSDGKIDVNSSIKGMLSLNLPVDSNALKDKNSFTVVLKIETDQGTFARELNIDLKAVEASDHNASGGEGAAAAGLIALLNPLNILLALVVIVAAIAIIAFFMYSRQPAYREGKPSIAFVEDETAPTAQQPIIEFASEEKPKPRKKRKAAKKRPGKKKK